MKKNFRLVLALVLAAMMIVSMIPAFGASGDMVFDTSVTVTGLDKGDTVNFYKIVKWTAGKGWEWETGYEAAVGNLVTSPDTAAKLFDRITGENKGTAQYTPGKISAADAAILAKAAVTVGGPTAGTMTSTSDAVGNTSASLALVPADANNPTDAEKMGFVGLYCALVTPATADTVYNPVFVAADFHLTGTTAETPNTQEATLSKSYQPEAQVKKETINLTKEVDVTSNGGEPVADTAGNYKYDLDVGDDVSFTITSMVPAYNGAYTDPFYELYDKMDPGLVLKSIDSVVIADVAANDTAYTQDPATVAGTETEFSIKLAKTTLDKVAALGQAKTITVKYTATIKTLDNANITIKNNEATVKFSNNPGDKNKYSLLEDRTTNYSFSIDANLFGQGSYENSELVKIGLSADGTEIMQSKQLDNGTWAGVLENASFNLYKADDQGNKTDTIYSNKVNGQTVTYNSDYLKSDANGKLHINGLDAGTYYLVEDQAPAGYIKTNHVYKIEIKAEYETVAGGTYINTDGILVKYDAYDVLKSYSVKVTDTTVNTDVTSNFTIVNEGDKVESSKYIKKSASSINKSSDNSTKIANIKGTELPSTGGIGTTIFYIGGSLMVLAAAILLITKRRMGAED